jgi:hypothetical protein
MQEYKYPKFNGDEPCVSVGLDVFYYMHEDDHSLKQVREDEIILRKVCMSCPILNECRDYAIHHEAYGFWGGTSHLDRERYRKKFNISLSTTHAWMPR